MWTVHSRRLSHRSSLEGGPTDLAEGRVPAPLVIEHVDVIEQLHLGFALLSKRSRSSLFTVEKKLSMTALS
jgi:hypothetical protein